MTTQSWQAIDTAPRDGTVFLALNHDGELWVAKFIDDRIVFRSNGRYEPRKFTYVDYDGERLLREDEQFAKDNERWWSHWTYWTRLYEFKPTHFCELPASPLNPSTESVLRLASISEHVEGVGK